MIEEFKIYVVNLKRDNARRKNIINEIEKQNIKNYEIIDAVAGDELNKNELDSMLIFCLSLLYFAGCKGILIVRTMKNVNLAQHMYH